MDALPFLEAGAVGAAVALVVVALAARLRARHNPVASAVSYAEQLGGTGEEKLRHAVQALQKFRRMSDAQARILIEAELQGRES
jgi:hypothetical protein